MTENKLAIVIPVFNNWRFTKRALQDLSALPPDHKLFIIDNGSTDETKKLQSSGNIHVIRCLENLGFGKSCNMAFNIAVEKFKFENVMFLNNDIGVFDKFDSWTANLISAAEQGFIIGPTAGCLADNFDFICESNKLPTSGYGYISGWNITASSNTWNKLILSDELGPFRSNSFFAYFEDTDLSFRAKKLGIELKIESVPVRHIGRVTGNIIGISKLYQKSRTTFIEIWGKKCAI
jgi:GT2 family glycosyltransferase